MTKEPGNTHGSTSLPDFEDLLRASRTFEYMAAEGRMALAMRTPAGAEQVWALLVSSDYFAMLRARPQIGRLFVAQDLDDLPAMVGERFWRDRLGGGDSIAGRTLTLNGRTFSIAGVLPEGFQGPGGLFEPAVWLPLERIDALNLSSALRDRSESWLGVTGRLKPGVPYADAEADLQAIARHLAAAYPATNRERGVTFRPVVHGNPEVQSLAPFAWIALGVVGLVLLIACFNVAGLLLARAVERQRELSIRSALGASRARIARQLIIEGTLLAGAAGAAAMVVAAWSDRLLAAFALPSPIPQRLHMPIDARLIGFTAAMAAVAGLLPAAVTTLQATRAQLFGLLKSDGPGGTRHSRGRSVFVVAQVAGSTMFLAAALLFVRSFLGVAAYHPGFDPARVLTVELAPAAYGFDVGRARAFFEAALERASAIRGITHAALGDRAPFFIGSPRSLEIATEDEDCSLVKCRTAFRSSVSRGYFTALGLPLVAGRDFTGDEIGSGTAVIVSAATASELWPDTSAVGRWMREGRGGPLRLVVGVAADVRRPSRPGRQALDYYLPLSPHDFAARMTLLLRTDGDVVAVAAAIRQQLMALDPDVPAYIRSMPQRMEVQLWPSRTAAGFLSVCGTLALTLATVGLFGVTYYAVNQRTREFGLRIALGATPQRVMSLVFREGLMVTAIGIAVGTAAALAAVRAVQTMLFGVGPGDPLAYGITAALQAVAALAACALPAYRATKADPMIALRQE